MRSITDAELRERSLARYRVMFRIVGVCLAAGVVMTAAGMLDILLQSTVLTIQVGVLLVALSLLVGYRITVSTMHLLEAQGFDRLR